MLLISKIIHTFLNVNLLNVTNYNTLILFCDRGHWWTDLIFKITTVRFLVIFLFENYKK